MRTASAALVRLLVRFTGTLYWYALLVRLLARDTRIGNKRRIEQKIDEDKAARGTKTT